MTHFNEIVLKSYRSQSMKFEFNGVHCAFHTKIFSAELVVDLNQYTDAEKKLGIYIGYDFDYETNKFNHSDINLFFQKKPEYGLHFANQPNCPTINLTYLYKGKEFKLNT